jgi:hypothetical protein
MPYNGNAAVVINKTVLSLKELAVWERTRWQDNSQTILFSLCLSQQSTVASKNRKDIPWRKLKDTFSDTLSFYLYSWFLWSCPPYSLLSLLKITNRDLQLQLYSILESLGNWFDSYYTCARLSFFSRITCAVHSPFSGIWSRCTSHSWVCSSGLGTMSQMVHD